MPFFEKYRINPGRKWAWEEENPKIWQDLRKKVLISQTYEIILQISMFAVIVYLPIDYRYSLETFPSEFEVIYQIVFFMITEDFFFYWGHRLFHLPYMYKRYHK